MTELRQRMDEAMIVRGFADRTRESYLWAVSGLAKFYHRSPDLISDEEIQAYLLHLIRDRQRSWSTCNIVVHGLRFLYHTTLKRDRMTFAIPSPRQPGTLPALLSRDEVQRLLAQAPNVKHRTMLLTTYAAGLRLNEVLHLHVTDIDSDRMTIFASSRGRAGATAIPCSRRTWSRRCARTGRWSAPRSGCFRRAGARSSRWIPQDCNGPIRRRSAEPASPSRAAFTRCGTPSRRTYSKPAPTSTPSNGCSGMGTSARRRATSS